MSLILSALGKSRFGQFRKGLPRREIEAIWAVLAFFAVISGDIKEVATSVRWKLLSSLFFYQTGVLGSVADNTSVSHIPSDTQINRCIVEIEQLKALVLSRALHPLPSDSTFVMKIVEKAINLEAESSRFKSAFEEMYHSEMKKYDVRFIYEVWEESNLWGNHFSQEKNESIVEILMKQSEFDDSFEKGSVFTLSPLTLLTTLSISLIEVWIAAHPNKKARWARLEDSLSSLLTKLSARSKSLALTLRNESKIRNGITDESETFANSFSNVTPRQEVNNSSSLIAYRETTAMVIIGILRARSKYERDNNIVIPLPSGNYDIEVCKQVRKGEQSTFR